MSGRIRNTWDRLGSEGRKALIPYVTPDFPVKDVTTDLVLAMDSAGIPFVEIGIPFSDPLADGPVIQHASQVALRNGATPDRVLDIVHEIRDRSTLPIILMGYTNPVLHLGADAFFRRAASAGVDGVIIPDLPPDESSDIHASAEENGLSMVYLLAPTTPDDRIRMIDDLSTDFTYCVSMTGVTGASARFDAGASLETFMRRVRSNTKKPFVVGFGISTRKDVEKVWQYADGAVVGSQVLRAIGKCENAEAVVREARTFIEDLLPG